MTESSAYWEDKESGFGLDCLLFQRDNDPSWSAEDTLELSQDVGGNEQRGGEEGDNAFDSLITDSLLELESGSGFQFLTNASLFSEDVDQCLREQGGRNGGLFEGGVGGMGSSNAGGGGGRADEDSGSLPSSSSTSSSLESSEGGGEEEVQLSLKCSECSKTFSNPLTLQVHMRLHTGERPYVCKECEEAFIHYTYLDFHMKNSHGIGDATGASNPLSFDWEEPECKPQEHINSSKKKKKKKKGTDQKNSEVGKSDGENKADVHSSEDDRERPHECESCGKRFLRLDNLKIHLRVHSGERPFECNICNKCFRQQSSRQRHLRTVHHIEIDRKGRRSDSQDLKVAPDTKKVKTETSETIHGNSFNGEAVNSSVVRLPQCDNSKTVIKTGESNQFKPKSKNVESKKSILEGHSHDADSMQSKPKRKKVKSKQAISEVQADSKQFNQKIPTLEPKVEVETPDPTASTTPDYVCDTCGKRLSRKNYLIEHMRKHTGEKPYECPTCGQKFSRLNSFWIHKRKHNYPDGKPFGCHHCDKRFSQKVYLLNHVKRGACHTAEAEADPLN